MWIFSLSVPEGELYMSFYSGLADYSFYCNDFLNIWLFSGWWLLSLHTDVFYRNPSLLPRCALSDTPVLVSQFCFPPPAAAAVLRFLLQAKRRYGQLCLFLFIRKMQASLQCRGGSCSYRPCWSLFSSSCVLTPSSHSAFYTRVMSAESFQNNLTLYVKLSQNWNPMEAVFW